MPTLSITREFTFDAAHQLTNYYGKCEQLHGHTYRLQVTLEGEIQSNGMVIDFVVLKRMVNKHIVDKLDHTFLNEIIPNPSAENLAIWMWNQLKDLPTLLKEELNDPNLPEELKKFLQQDEVTSETIKQQFQQQLRLVEIKLWESSNTSVSYRGA